MKTRHFGPGPLYRIVEMRQPLSRLDEQLINAKVRFMLPCKGLQDAEGFLTWSHNWSERPIIEILSGPRKGMTWYTLPRCRLLKTKKPDESRCTCSAYHFPHRFNSGACNVEK